MSEWIYNKKLALITAVVLTIGSSLIFAINSAGSLNPAWDNFIMVVFPLIWFISFVPLGICSLINKIKEKK